MAHACLSHYDRDRYDSRQAWNRRLKTSAVRVQWDPQRSLRLQPLSRRSLQVGLSGQAVDRYIDDGIVGISDVTPIAHAIRDRLHAGDETAAAGLLPEKRPYPPPDTIEAITDASAP